MKVKLKFASGGRNRNAVELIAVGEKLCLVPRRPTSVDQNGSEHHLFGHASVLPKLKNSVQITDTRANMNAHKKRKTANGAAPVPAEEGAEHNSGASSRSPSPSSAAVVHAASSSSSSAVATSKPRPARKQITPQELESIKVAADKSAQTGVTYNIWHNKWAGGDSYDAAASHRKAETRCDIARDSGYTRGDVNGGAYVCLYFARGYCPLG